MTAQSLSALWTLALELKESAERRQPNCWNLLCVRDRRRVGRIGKLPQQVNAVVVYLSSHVKVPILGPTTCRALPPPVVSHHKFFPVGDI